MADAELDPEELDAEQAAHHPLPGIGARRHHAELRRAGRRNHGRMLQSRTPNLALTLAEAASDFARQPTRTALMSAITGHAVRIVAGAEYAALTELVDGRDPATRAATDPVVEKVEQVQTTTGEGPCLSAIRDEPVIVVADLVVEQRWPGYVNGVAERFGVRSMLCLRIAQPRAGRPVAALNLYATGPDTFDDVQIMAGQLLAVHAAAALSAARTAEDLNEAVVTRDVIGQAKGILMERYGVGADEAFQMLIDASQGGNVKLRQLARQVATTRELPERPRSAR